MSEQRDIDALLEQCRSSSPDHQIKAMRALEVLGSRAAVPMILPLLTSENEHVRETAVHVLEQLGDDTPEEVGPALEARLKDREELIRSSAAEALGALRYAPGRASIEYTLHHDKSELVRASAAEALGELGDVRALDALEAALADDDAVVRGYTALSIGLLGDKFRLPAIQRQLAMESDYGTRGELIAAALRLGHDDAFDELLMLIARANEELALILYNTIDDLLSRRTPSVMVSRGSDLDEHLAALASLSDIVEAHVANLRARMVEGEQDGDGVR